VHVGEDRPLVAEQLQRDQPGEEHRQRYPGQRDAHREPVEDAAPAQRGQHADGHPADQPEHGCPDGQRQRDRGRLCLERHQQQFMDYRPIGQQ